MVVNRYVRANPVKTSSEAWDFIVKSVCNADETTKKELRKASAIISSIIVEEGLKDHPVVFVGAGPRARFFCLYADAAIESDFNEDPVSGLDFINPNWKVYVPISKEDLWARRELEKASPRFEAYDPEKGYSGEHVVKASRELQIDMKAFSKL